MRGEYADDTDYQRMADLYSEEPVKHSGEYDKTFVIDGKEYTASVNYNLTAFSDKTVEFDEFDALIWDEDDVYYYDGYYINKPDFDCVNVENKEFVESILKNVEVEIADDFS